MRFIKKFVVCLLVFAMLLTGVQSFAGAAETEEAAAPETYTQNIELLTALGIYSFGGEAYSDTVTRAQFARMVMELIHMEDAVLSEEVYFSDVNEDTPYAAEIHTAAAMGIMNGMGDTTFRPTEEITYVQAIKVLVSALGYHPLADGKGGYTNGYVRCADSIGLLTGAPADYDMPLTFETAAQLIKRAGETAVFEVIGVNGKNMLFSSSKDKQTLGVYHNIYKATAQMTDNGITALSGKSTVGTGAVIIGGSTFIDASAQAKELLGCTVTYYYQHDTGDDTLLYAMAEARYNEVVTVKADELAPDAAAFSKTCLVAEKDGREKEYKIYTYANLIYNGSYDATFTAKSMKIKSGEIRLIDADKDGKYETVMVEEYKDILISSVLGSEDKLFAKRFPSGYGAINYGDYETVIFEDGDGNALTAGDVAEDTVVSVFKSKDTAKIRFVISKQTKEITLSELVSENGLVLFDGVESYPLSSTYEELRAAGNTSYPMPAVGSMYKLYLNFEGKAAALDELQGREQYAYFLGLQQGKGLQSDTYQLRLYLDSNDCITVTTAKKLTVNKLAAQPSDLALPANKLVDAAGAVKPQLVKITLNTKGELTELETAQNDTAYFTANYQETVSGNAVYGFDLNRMSFVYQDKTDSSGITAYAAQNTRVLQGGYAVDKDTKFFVVTENSSLETTNENDVKVISWNDFCRFYSRAYVKLYDADENWVCAGAVVGPIMYENSRPLTVESSATIVDEYGETKLKVSGWYKDNFWHFREYSDGVFADAVKAAGYADGAVKPGDVYEIAFATDGISVAKAVLLYSPLRFGSDTATRDINYYSALNQPTVPLPASETWVLGVPLVKGNGNVGVKVEKKQTSSVVGDAASYSTDEKYFPNYFYSTGAFVLKFDCRTKKLTKSSANEIPVLSSVSASGTAIEAPTDQTTKVFLMRSRGVVSEVLIVTNLDALR